MEHIAPPLVDQLITSGKAEFLLFLVEGMYSPIIGFFSNLPNALLSIQNRDNAIPLLQDFESHVLQPHISRMSHIIATAASRVTDVSSLSILLDKYVIIQLCALMQEYELSHLLSTWHFLRCQLISHKTC